MAGGGGSAEGTSLEYTPTWVVASVCTIIVGLSLAAERALHYTGKYLNKKNQKPLFDALLKVKEELMLLGFISLMLTVFQGRIVRICMDRGPMDHLLPCALPRNSSSTGGSSGHHRRLLAAAADEGAEYCASRNQIPLLSLEAIHELHIFIFVLAIVHVTFSVLTVMLGSAKIRQWKKWEEDIAKSYDDESVQASEPKIMYTHDHEFIKNRLKGYGHVSPLRVWGRSFVKQFYGSVTKSDYSALRLGFIMAHWPGNLKFNFYEYMVKVLEDDFKKVVGTSWYLWIFVVTFLLLNVNGWHTYFWIAFLPLLLLLIVGTKLERVIHQLAQEVAEKHVAIEGDIVVKPSDDHFWFRKPRIVLVLIHFILFQNSFEIAFFFWVWVQYGFNSCIMGRIALIAPRLVVSVFIQLLCSYSTLPLYALVTQMGSNYKRVIFNERVQTGAVGWAKTAKKNKGLPVSTGASPLVGGDGLQMTGTLDATAPPQSHARQS